MHPHQSALIPLTLSLYRIFADLMTTNKLLYMVYDPATLMWSNPLHLTSDVRTLVIIRGSIILYVYFSPLLYQSNMYCK